MVKKQINPINVCDGLSIHFAKFGEYNHITIHTGVLGGQELDVYPQEIDCLIDALKRAKEVMSDE